MKRNVIILTSGLSGSSVLTGLIVRAGYWAGDNTHKKEDYDTYENPELIRLNKQLFSEAGYTGNYLRECSTSTIQQVAGLHGKIDDGPYREFVRACNGHRPWVWKDPRLWLTIRFWNNLLERDACRFILLTRGITQSWVSATLRRQIRNYGEYRRYEECITDSVLKFFSENDLAYAHVRYEDLIVHPAESISTLNRFLGTDLAVADLTKVYRKPLFKSPGGSMLDYARAVLIYLKNYPGASVRQ